METINLSNFFICLFFSNFFCCPLFYKPAHKTIKINPSTENIVFAFDIHKVVMRPDISKMVKLAFSKLKWGILPIFFEPILWYYIFSEGASPERVINKIAQKYKNKGVTKEFLIKFLNSQIVDQSMINLILKLKKDGYKVYAASNIWSELLDDLKKEKPIFNDLFDGIYHPTKGNPYEKPEKHYYQNLKKYLKDHGEQSKKIIFIDDRYENVSAAIEEGLIGIRFKNSSNLVKNLNSLGFNNISLKE